MNYWTWRGRTDERLQHTEDSLKRIELGVTGLYDKLDKSILQIQLEVSEQKLWRAKVVWAVGVIVAISIAFGNTVLDFLLGMFKWKGLP